MEATKKEEEWVEVPVRKNPQKKKDKKAPERPGRPRSEAVLIKPAKGMSYASIHPA